MEVGIIVAISTVIWFIVDRFKEVFSWTSLKYGNWITTAIVAGLAAFAVVTFPEMDILLACGVCASATVFGAVMTVLLIAGGSSCLAEIIKKLKG